MVTVIHSKSHAALAQMLRYAIAQLTDHGPTVHPDGRLEFDHAPESIPGYRKNNNIFEPEWVPCNWLALHIDWCDGLQLSGQCQNPSCPRHLQMVDPTACRECH